MIKVEIHDPACRGCELCVDICPTDVFTYDQATHKAKVAVEEDCIGCLSCAYICPSGAITHEDFHITKNFYRDLDFSRRVGRFL